MKNFSLFLYVVVVIMFMASFGKAQVQFVGPAEQSYTAAELKVKEKFETLKGVKNFSKVRATDPKTLSAPIAEGTSLGPGDVPIFLLHANRVFVRRGEIVDFNLVPITYTTDTFYVAGRIFKPGYAGYYDGTQPVGYFNSETGTARGTITGDWHKALSRMFNQEEMNGWYQIDFIVWDVQGNLVQQIWANIYLTDAGPIKPMFRVQSVKATDYSLSLSGQFPVGAPIFYMIGVPKFGYLLTGPDPAYAAYSTSGGRRLELSGRTRFYNLTSVDVMMWTPYSRQAILAPHVMMEESTAF